MLAQDLDLSEELRQAFAAHSEWLLNLTDKIAFALEASEMEVYNQNGKLILTCPTSRGWQNWIIKNWQLSDEKIIVHTARKLNSDETALVFTPRVSVDVLREETNAARLAKANELAETARQMLSNRAKIERVSLNQSNQRGKVGTIARVLLKLPNGKTVAVCGSVVEKATAENLLSNALLWFSRLQERRSISELWLVADEKSAEDLSRFHALLRDGWREQIKIYTQRRDGETPSLEAGKQISFNDLWLEKPKKIARPKLIELSETAKNILSFAPDEIDVTRSRYGETLRFNGLAFARVREIMGAERTWFGIQGKPQKILDENSWAEFEMLLFQLRQRRQADAGEKRNFLYRAAPEAWLESILRRDISRLDPNLVLAPLFAQFRLSNKQGSLDLLALRTDGRLVVIELKTSTDREHLFQAVDYWRQVEQQRRAGNFAKTKLFGDLPILDAPPLVYLVAPLMSFHHDFEILANAVASEIEIWRFDLNEDWRGGIRVARRTNTAKNL
jgi:hypothetical protein